MIAEIRDFMKVKLLDFITAEIKDFMIAEMLLIVHFTVMTPFSLTNLRKLFRLQSYTQL